ncbi:MAG: hypothetical protein U9R26_08495, partial [Campylobacterota bacterium]|nr:hypothetical protein [Campylobacterota bacterium]
NTRIIITINDMISYPTHHRAIKVSPWMAENIAGSPPLMNIKRNKAPAMYGAAITNNTTVRKEIFSGKTDEKKFDIFLDTAFLEAALAAALAALFSWRAFLFATRTESIFSFCLILFSSE